MRRHPAVRLLHAVDRDGERWLLLVFYTLIVTVIATEVIRRFGLSYSSIWNEEIARYAFIYLAWIGAAAAVRERAHIRIDILIQVLPPRGRAALYLLSDVLTLVLALICLYWSLQPIVTALKFGSVTHGLRISNAWFLAAVPLGFSLVVLRVVQSMRRDAADLLAGRPVFEGRRLFD